MISNIEILIVREYDSVMENNLDEKKILRDAIKKL